MPRPYWREFDYLTEALAPAGTPPYPREGGQRNGGPRRRCKSCLALNDTRDPARRCGRCGSSLRRGELTFGGRPDVEPRPVTPASKARLSPALSETEAVLLAAEGLEAEQTTVRALANLREASRRCLQGAADRDFQRDRERGERRRSAGLWREPLAPGVADAMLGGDAP